MKVYLAAQYKQKDDLIRYAAELKELGIEVTSRWLNEPHSTTTELGELHPDDLERYAMIDLYDIDMADAFVFFSLPDSSLSRRGGRHVEFGYAIASRTPILVVGPHENIFHYLDGVTHVDRWEDATKWLSGMAAELK